MASGSKVLDELETPKAIMALWFMVCPAGAVIVMEMEPLLVQFAESQLIEPKMEHSAVAFCLSVHVKDGLELTAGLVVSLHPSDHVQSMATIISSPEVAVVRLTVQLLTPWHTSLLEALPSNAIDWLSHDHGAAVIASFSEPAE